MLEKTENPTVTSLNGSKNEDTDNNPQIRNVNTSDEETDTPTNRFTKSRKRIQKFSESDSDENIVDDTFPICTDHAQSNTSSDSDETSSSLINKSKKSRLKTIDDSGSDFDSNYDLKILPKTKEHSLCSVSSHESDSNSESTKATKNKEQQIRMKNKRSKLKNKFKSLLSSRNKSAIGNKEDSSHDNEANASMSEISGNEESSLENIKKTLQIKKEKTTSLKMSICDPDISDEENDKPKHKSKMPQRQTKATSPKPLRMSAKQAMENMQKIKSESNRMLREKEVSLPYHRPKALNLKDIMSRRRPALSADGKVLPIKMNEEQLRQYANQLELRQKDMMELCKSETEDEDDEGNTNENPKDADAPNSISTTENGLISSKIDINSAELPEASNDLICNNVTDSNSLPCTGNPELPNEITCNNIVDEIELNEENVCEKSEDVSAEMQLVYNDSVEECTENCGDGSSNLIAYNTQETEEPIKNMSLENETHIQADSVVTDINRIDLDKSHDDNTKCTVRDSQIILLQYDTEDTEVIKSDLLNLSKHDKSNNCGVSGIELPSDLVETSAINEFPNDDMEINDINMDELDNIIQNAEAVKDADINNYKNSPASVRDSPNLNIKPKLTGEPGMVIDLDGNDPIAPRKLSGVELLKERFTFYAKLKTPEELERDRERRQKPGTQHIKLKQELEDKIAEQRSLEWAKRLENEKQQQEELDAIRGDDISDTENDIDKIEEKLQDNDLEDRESSEESEEEEEIEDDVFIEDNPRKISALIADEAEESDDEDADQNNDENDDDEDGNVDNNEIEDKKADEDESSSEDEESSESEAENESKPRKRRILKAFEDSDDEEAAIIKDDNPISVSQIIESENIPMVTKQNIPDSQDDDLQLAQAPKSMSDDIFASPVSNMNNASSMETTQAVHKTMDEVELGTQTFSIMSSNTLFKSNLDLELNGSEKLNVIAETQNNDNLDAVVGMCSGSFSQNCLDIQPPTTQTQQLSIGEDLLDMCTGKFYDSEFVSQSEEKVAHTSDDMSQDSVFCLSKDKTQTKAELSKEEIEKTKEESQKKVEGDILKSVLDELDEQVEANKPLKYFFDGKNYKESEPNVYNTQLKKKFVIDSDDENSNVDSVEKKKKVKKKKPEKRALQISDDEDEYSEQEVDEHLSEDDDLIDNAGENLVEYDSEENEIEVKEAKLKKKKKVAEFFEREAELSSEDEWAGSGDEDERGLDRLEREAGDDDAFHLGRLQRQLGHIHMREVLDQDKREVRIIQELLFEDGDLGGGGRQRKFRWRNADGEEETGTVPDQLADTQEEEFESEELWRKQRHEREVFLRQMKNGDEEQDQNITINRTSIIKANLHSRAMSSLLEEAANKAANDTVKSPPAPEKKTVNDIPSPKKSFPVFKHNYHGSLLTRGRGALARLAALATPLAVDDDAPKTLAASSKRNFVFATLTPEEKGPKVTKRKAETNIGTPRLVKKMKTVEKQKAYKNSLLDHLKT